ncbi:RRP15-like protein [Zingiber officinale]|uniref:RRP15-like protein n=1 Tax=Zingiber officinale TaxID=94328 RepID=UPI001C4B02BD|nr:RRP15-like protein [Zingiber officinale]
MAAVLQTFEAAAAAPTAGRKRKSNHSKAKKPSKRFKPTHMVADKHRQPSNKMKKLFRKRAREYHSDEEEGVDEEIPADPSSDEEENGEKDLDVGDYGGGDSEGDEEEDEEGGKHGITRFLEGCRAFKVAFAKIMKKHLQDDPLGPVLSAHKKLVAEKLADEDSEQKMKGETKKLKQSSSEKGHVKPDTFLDAKEKLLISIATKGVVKLFNAVSKAQNSLNSSSSKDAKALAKRRKQAFFSELQKPTTQISDSSKRNSNEPGWAPLREGYMLTNTKLKDWDKMAEPSAEIGAEKVLSDSSSEEE